MIQLADSGAVELAARVRSPRPSRKGGVVGLWQITDPVRAHALLDGFEQADPQMSLPGFDGAGAGG
ncbi:MAG: hypothetical protein ACLFTT_09335 [Candidatus Hydrogenedentota bacterium]